jgi:predicted PurR-regulated permease PerM
VVNAGDTFGLQLAGEDVEKEIQDNLGKTLRDWLAPVALGTGQYLASFAIGLLVMVVALYYFLADGPAMVKTVMRLSPLDDRYEDQLLQQFDRVSRSVVLAVLVSAAVQGLLTGVGLYLAGFQSFFLLTLLAMLLAMVPFVGAAAVWVPASLWLFFHDGRVLAAVLLALYGALIVSMVDNVIKPLILHGGSNIHPLLALLSVLGGVQALGPIGIFVGPMVVAFLQTLLNMLHGELESMKLASDAAGRGAGIEDR